MVTPRNDPDDPVDRGAETVFQPGDIDPYAQTQSEIGGRAPRASDTVRSCPARIGPYQVEGELGRGGMGVVYLARHVETQTQVALKLLLSEGQSSFKERDRFIREGESAARLDHRGIVKVHERGTTGEGKLYLAMEYVEGPTLHKILHSLSLEDLVHIMACLARAVGHAHTNQIVHRDLKPANVLIRESNGQPVVTDFGLARPLDRESLTKTGMIMGTPQYLAPEQADDSKSVTPASDVYALGTIFYEGLTGRTPFAHVRGAALQLLRAILTEVPKPPSATNHRVPAVLERICMKALAKDPAERYPDGVAMANALEAAQDELYGETSDVPVLPMLEALKVPDAERDTLQPTYAEPSTVMTRIRSGVFGSLGVVLLSTSFCCASPWLMCLTGDLQTDRDLADVLEATPVLSPAEATKHEGLVVIENAVATVDSALMVGIEPCVYVKTATYDLEEGPERPDGTKPSPVRAAFSRDVSEAMAKTLRIGPLRVETAGIDVTNPTSRAPRRIGGPPDGRELHEAVWETKQPSTILGYVNGGVLGAHGQERFLVVLGKSHAEWIAACRDEGFSGVLRGAIIFVSALIFVAALISFALRKRREQAP